MGIKHKLSVCYAPGTGGTIELLVDNGQLFWAQAHYVRANFTRTGVGGVDKDDAIAAAICTALYGYWDLSVDILRKSGSHELAAKLTEVLRN